MKQTVSNYTISGSTITLTNYTTVHAERLLLIVDTTTDTTLYQFNNSPGVTFATNVITFPSLSAVGGTDKLLIIYDNLTGDPTYDTPVLPNNAASESGGNLATIASNTAGSSVRGQHTAQQSQPVVLANDVPVSTDLLVATVLDDLRAALMAIAGAKGVLADLRVTPTGTVAISGATTISSGTVTSVTNLAQVGGVTANSVVQDWENQTYTSTFSANITRP